MSPHSQCLELTQFIKSVAQTTNVTWKLKPDLRKIRSQENWLVLSLLRSFATLNLL